MLKCRIKICKLSELKNSSGRFPEPGRGQSVVKTVLPGAPGLLPFWYRRRSQRWPLQGSLTGLAERGQLPAVPPNTCPTYRITSSPPAHRSIIHLEHQGNGTAVLCHSPNQFPCVITGKRDVSLPAVAEQEGGQSEPVADPSPIPYPYPDTRPYPDPAAPPPFEPPPARAAAPPCGPFPPCCHLR